MTMLSDLLERDRARLVSASVRRVAARSEAAGVPSTRAGERWPDFETWDRICKLYGWPQTFVKGG